MFFKVLKIEQFSLFYNSFIEQAHATNQFDDIDKPEVQTLLKDRLDGKRKVLFI